MSNAVRLTTTGTPATVTIDDLGGITFVHPQVNIDLVSPDGFLDYESVLESLETGDLGAAEIAGEIILTDINGNSITPGSDSLTFVSLTQTETIQGRKTFADDKIIIDAPSATTNFEIGYFDDLAPADPNSYGFRLTSGSGVFSWANNANFPQIFAGSPTGTGSTFFDATNNRPLFLNVLDTGPDDPGRVTIGIGGLTIEGSSEIAPTNPLSVFRDDTVPILSFEVESDGTLTVGTTTTYENLVLADNDIPNRKWVLDRLAEVGGGAGGASSGFIEYKFDNSTTMANPGSGEFRYNNSTPALVTAIAIADESETGGDVSGLLGFLNPGNFIYIQEIEDAGAFLIAEIVSTVDNGSWWQLNVTISDSGTLPDVGKECGVNFLYIGLGGQTTDNLAEGVTNLYYTEARVNANASVVANTAKVSADGSINTHSDVNIVGFNPGEVLFINPSSEVATSSLLQLGTAGCSIRTVDDTGLDWCNEQVGVAGSAFAVLKRSLGTIGGELPLGTGDKIGGWGWVAQDGVTSNPGFVSIEISGYATEPQTGTEGGGEMRFFTTPNGTKLTQTQLRIENDGTLSVADQTDYENKVLDDDDIPNRRWVLDQLAMMDLPATNYITTVSFPLTTTPTYVDFPTQEVENNTAVIEQNSGDTSRFDLKETGLYGIAINANVDAGGTPLVTTRAVLNGTTVIPGTEFVSDPTNNPAAVTPFIVAEFTAGDFIQVESFTNTGTGTVEPNSGLTIIRFRGVKGDKGDPGAGSTIILQEEGTNVTNTPHDTIDFDTTTFDVTDNADGSATVTGKKSWSYDVARNATAQTAQFLRRQNGTPTNLLPYIAPVNCTIWAVTAEHQPTQTTVSWDFVVQVNGATVHTESITVGNTNSFNNGLAISVSAGDEITMQQLNESAGINYPGGSVHFIEA